MRRWNQSQFVSTSIAFASVVAISLGSLALVGCEEETPEVTEEEGPIVGLMEVPISRNHSTERPREALRVEVSPTELRLDGERVLELERGRVAPGQLTGGTTIAPLGQRVAASAARSRVVLRAHSTVPYVTFVQILETLYAGGLREVHLTVRAVGETPVEGYMRLPVWQIAPAGEENVSFPGRALPWSTFSEHWQEVYDACRAGQYIDCDARALNIAEGGELQLELWTRGQGMKVTFRQVNAPEPTRARGGGGVQMIEGIAARPSAEPAEEGPPAAEAAFNFRLQEATGAESALSNAVGVVCGSAACRAVFVADASAPFMRVASMLGAAFPSSTASPELAFRRPE